MLQNNPRIRDMLSWNIKAEALAGLIHPANISRPNSMKLQIKFEINNQIKSLENAVRAD